ncbi:MAG TPA: tol-pal system protein YbgF [Smithella sp.]|nr:tol-pal system protein YbgF [Smithella sp.]
MRYFKYLVLFIAVLLLAGCATSGDLRALRAEMNQKMDDRLATLETEIAALKKTTESLEALRNTQANTAADMADVRDNLQQLRGQIESLKKDFSAFTKKEDQRFENILLKINFIENFLEIGNKNISGDTPDKNGKSAPVTASKDAAQKSDKDKAYSAAYQTFTEGNYDKARTEFQNYLASYPNSEYSDNAQFWIGECYFFEKKYETAILEYEKVTKNYPNSNKVPYALLKQGLAFLKLGDKTSAKLLLQEVIKKYPNTSQARIARSNLQDIK